MTSRPGRGSILVLACALILGTGLGVGLVFDWFGALTDSTPDKKPNPEEQDRKLSLDEEQRKYLWEVEHETLVLNKHWFKEFGEALSRADEPALRAMLADGFKGELLNQPAEERIETAFVKAVRKKDAGHKPLQVDASAFIAQLMEYRRAFAIADKPPKVKVAVKNLTPINRDDYGGAWQGTGFFRMWGESKPGQPREVAMHMRFDLPRPKEESEPGWLRKCTITQSQEADAPRYFLKNVTEERGVDTEWMHDNWKCKLEERIPTPGSVLLCDYDRDGILDMLIVETKGVALYKGLPGGKFKDVTKEVGLADVMRGRAHGPIAVFVDIDGDGWEDLVIGSYIFRNDEGKKFDDYTHKCNLRKLVPPDAQTISVADYDRDGKLDLYIVRKGLGKAGSWLDGKGRQAGGNRLLRNKGDWQFEDVTAKAGADGGNRSVFAAAWLDANNDGWPDVYVPNEFGNGVLLLNNGDGTFREHMIMSGPLDFGTMGIAAGDVNNDGNIDIFLGNMYSKAGRRIMSNLKPNTYPPDIMATLPRFVAGSQMWINQGRDKFKPVGEEWQVNDIGWSYGPNLFDLDNDGFLDLYCTTGFMTVDRNKPDG